MDPIPYENYQNELQSLGYSPILGNKEKKSCSQIPKFNFDRPRSNSFSANSVAKSLTFGNVTPRKRPFSVAKLSPS